jgi:uncharacterized protein GlcG (DUF336 family)
MAVVRLGQVLVAENMPFIPEQAARFDINQFIATVQGTDGSLEEQWMVHITIITNTGMKMVAIPADTALAISGFMRAAAKANKAKIEMAAPQQSSALLDQNGQAIAVRRSDDDEVWDEEKPFLAKH